MGSPISLQETFVIARSVTIKSAEKSALSFPIMVEANVVPAVQFLLNNKYTNYTIHKRLADWHARQFYSMLERFDTHAIAHISANLNVCWQRFAFCKEIGHLVLDTEPDQMTTDAAGLIGNLITTPSFVQDPLMASESAGVIFAMEVMMPWRFRKQLMQMKEQGKTDLEVAKLCKLPEKYVGVMLSGSYGRISNAENSRLDMDHKS